MGKFTVCKEGNTYIYGKFNISNRNVTLQYKKAVHDALANEGHGNSFLIKQFIE